MLKHKAKWKDKDNKPAKIQMYAYLYFSLEKYKGLCNKLQDLVESDIQ